MAIIKNCEIHYLRAHPTRHPRPYKQGEPSKWSVMLRTSDKAQRDHLKSLGLKVKAVVPDDDGDPYFTVNIYKNVTKKDGSPAAPVEVTDGNGSPIDPDRVGNGSIANVRIYQWENGNGGISTQLMAVQLVTWLVKEPSGPREDFDKVETRVVYPEESEGDAGSAPNEEAPY